MNDVVWHRSGARRSSRRRFGSPLEATYQEIAPDRGRFPVLDQKIKTLDMTPFASLLGGGAMGDLAGLPKARLAILSGTTHFVPPGSGIMDRHDWLLAMIPSFIDAPLPPES